MRPKGNHWDKSGQGLVEYALILVLVALVLAGLLLFWPGPQLMALFSGGGTQPTGIPDVIPTDVLVGAQDGEIVGIVEAGSTVEVADTEVTSTNNCSSSNPTTVQTQRSRTIEHVVVLEGTGGVTVGDMDIASIPILKFLKFSLQGKYGVQDKESETRSYTISFSTGAHTFATHTLTWKYSWKQGQAVVRMSDGSERVYDYRIRLSLEPETVSEEKPCEAITSVP